MTDERTIEAVCEACGTVSPMPWNLRGRIGECPCCYRWMDVPDPTNGFEALMEPPCDLPTREDLGLKFDFYDGFPRPLWEGVHDRLSSHTDPNTLHQLWSEVVEVWLQSLISVLDDIYRVERSENFAILTHLEAEDAFRLLQQLEDDLLSILQLLDGVADDTGYGPHVVLAFHGEDAYYHYVAPYYPDGESGGSEGMFIPDNFQHIAICFRRPGSRSTLVHELTHSLLSHLPLPLWMNEGITLIAEGAVAESRHFAPSRESLREQQSFWSQHSLNDFWNGAAFIRPDDGQKFAYELAELLVRNLYSEDRGKLRELLNSAVWDDAGEQGLRDSFGLDLQSLIEGVFGAGNWRPQEPLFPRDSEASGLGGSPATVAYAPNDPTPAPSPSSAPTASSPATP